MKILYWYGESNSHCGGCYDPFDDDTLVMLLTEAPDQTPYILDEIKNEIITNSFNDGKGRIGPASRAMATLSRNSDWKYYEAAGNFYLRDWMKSLLTELGVKTVDLSEDVKRISLTVEEEEQRRIFRERAKAAKDEEIRLEKEKRDAEAKELAERNEREAYERLKEKYG